MVAYKSRCKDMKILTCPRDGSIVRIALTNGWYAYVYHDCRGGRSRLYGFVTDSPIANKEFFKSTRWKWLLTTYAFPPGSVVCESIPELRNDIDFMLPNYIKIPTTSSVFDPAKPYLINPGDGIGYFGTERDIMGLPREYDGCLEKLIPLIMGFDEEMEHIEVAPDMVDGRKPKESRIEEVERILEIVFPSDSDGLLIRRDEIEEALDEALTEADVGEIMGAGGSSDGSFDLAATVNPRRIKSALRIIRKILLKFKAPDTVKILEQHPGHEEPIEHGIH